QGGGLVGYGQQARGGPASLLRLRDALLVEADLGPGVKEEMVDPAELHRADERVGVVVGAVLAPSLVSPLYGLCACHIVFPLRIWERVHCTGSLVTRGGEKVNLCGDRQILYTPGGSAMHGTSRRCMNRRSSHRGRGWSAIGNGGPLIRRLQQGEGAERGPTRLQTEKTDRSETRAVRFPLWAREA